MIRRMIENLIAGLEKLVASLKARQKPPVSPVEPLPPIEPLPPPVSPHFEVYEWDTPEHGRYSVRVICDEEGLNVNLKNILTACVQVESNFNPKAVHYNKNSEGHITSTDYGICQINDYFQIGPGKPFPSSQYVLDNPETSVRWMAKMFQAGKMKLWSSYTNGSYKKYL